MNKKELNEKDGMIAKRMANLMEDYQDYRKVINNESLQNFKIEKKNLFDILNHLYSETNMDQLTQGTSYVKNNQTAFKDFYTEKLWEKTSKKQEDIMRQENLENFSEK